MAQEPKAHAADMKRKSRPNIGPVELSVIKLDEKGRRGVSAPPIERRDKVQIALATQPPRNRASRSNDVLK